MSELTPIREIVEVLTVKEPIFRRKSSKCSNSHHKQCMGGYRSSHGGALGRCMCLCHTAEKLDPNL